jgi:hypothetical protein
MTLATLKGMKVPLAGLAEVLKATPDKPAQAAVDPMQWWGALTQQFSDIAAQAVAAPAQPAPARAAPRKRAARSRKS